MKPAPFAYVRARTLEEVFDLLEKHGDSAKILAGGQSLMATLNMRLSAPALLVDIGRIDDLTGIEDVGDAIRIGATTRHADVEASAEVAAHAPLIALAMPHVAHPAIRNFGTFGGSIAFADPAAELPACAVALGARMLIAGKEGERAVDADSFFRGLYETAIGPGEILAAVEIPKTSPDRKPGFMELARRHGDYAIIGLAADAEVDGGAFGDARLAFFGAGDRPVAARRTAALLRGRPWSEELAAQIADSLKNELDPPEDLNADGAMRRHLAGVLAKRTLGPMA